MTAILVTGASGFVGRHLCRAIRTAFPAARLVTPASPGDNGATRQTVDLLDRSAVFDFVDANTPDVVVHLAAQSSVGRTLAEGDRETWSVNVDGTGNLAEAIASAAPTATVLFTSSSEVYGGAFSAKPVDESVAPAPLNAYARSKLEAEGVLAAVLAESNQLLIARPFNHTGPGQRDDFVLASFALQVARCEAGLQPPVLRVGNLAARRDFLDVRDVATAYLALIEHRRDLPSRLIVNIASGTAYALDDLLQRLLALARCDISVAIDPARMRPSDVPIARGSAALLNKFVGWRPTIAIDTMLADLLDAARRTTSAALDSLAS